MEKLRTSRRIAFVSDAIYPYNKGGKEKRLYEISTRLAKSGHTVDIYTMQWWDGPKTIQENGVTLHAICRLHPLYQGERRSFAEAIWFGLATFKLMGARFDTLDVDSMPFFPLFSARLVCWLRRKRLFATWHEVTSLATWQAYVGQAAGLVAWTIERLATLMPDTIISNSRHTTGRLRQSGVKKPVVTVPLGVDLQRIYAAKPSTDRSDVIFTGRLLEHKNAALLVQAIAMAKITHPHILCKIVGQGPEHAHLAKLIARLELQDNVQLMGNVEHDTDLYGLMKASKIFVLPSVREGFGLVAIEAAAAGLPVITTSHPDNATRELIVSDVNGYLVEPDASAIAQKIILILDTKPALHPQAGLEQYDWDQVTASLNRAFAG